MYRSLPHFVLGYHGCDAEVAERIFSGAEDLIPSVNSYDWLGNGIYFWENNPARALDFANQLKSRKSKGRNAVKTPAVVGGVLNLGRCLNLLDASAIELVRSAHAFLKQELGEQGVAMPVNESGGSKTDLLLRHLDRAVIEHLHFTLESTGQQPFDSVRGVFVEGPAIYPNAGFHESSHIQLCVRNTNCIKGYFRVRTASAEAV